MHPAIRISAAFLLAFLFAIAVLILSVVALMLLLFVVQKPYRTERLLILLNPERDPLGSGNSAVHIRSPILPPWRATAGAVTMIVVVGSVGYAIGTRRRTIP